MFAKIRILFDYSLYRYHVMIIYFYIFHHCISWMSLNCPPDDVFFTVRCFSVVKLIFTSFISRSCPAACSHVIWIMFVVFPEDMDHRNTVQLDLEQQICVHAAWILDQLFYTAVKWLSRGVTQQNPLWSPHPPDVTLSFFRCVLLVFGGRQTINHLNARVCSNKN